MLGPISAKGTSRAEIGRPSRRRQIAAIVVTVVVLILSSIDQSILSVAMPAMKMELRLSDSHLGLLSSLPFAIGTILVGVPAAWLGDTRLPRTTVVAASLAIWSVMTALCGAGTGLISLFLLRTAVGLGEASGKPNALSVVIDIAPTAWRRRIVALCSVGTIIG